MPDLLTPLFAVPAPTADRPLSGVTLLLVEDSRYASEAVRLLCLRSGARIRRADSLRAAERHLATYRPTAVLIDLGLPDGSGLDLIARLAAATPRLTAILATSAEDSMRDEALAAGADRFLAKPVFSLSEFQCALLGALGVEGAATRLRLLTGETVHPDPIAYRDDLAAVSELLSNGAEAGSLGYAARFLAGIAMTADDPPLAEAASSLSEGMMSGRPTGAILARVAGMVAERLSAGTSPDDGLRLA
jgi:CheY-like chemotaxis protein